MDAIVQYGNYLTCEQKDPSSMLSLPVFLVVSLGQDT